MKGIQFVTCVPWFTHDFLSMASGFPSSSISSLAVGSGNNNNNNNGLSSSSSSSGLSRGGAMSSGGGGGASVSSIFSNLQSSLSSAFSQPPSGSSFLKDDRDNSSGEHLCRLCWFQMQPRISSRGRVRPSVGPSVRPLVPRYFRR